MLTPEQRKRFEKTFPALRKVAPHLTAPAWAYEPYPGRFDSPYCVYCGERARTYDVIVNKLYEITGGHGPMRHYLLVASCTDCHYFLAGDDTPVNMNQRKRALIIELRRRYNHSCAPKSSSPKQLLLRRIQYLTRNIKVGDEKKRIGARSPRCIYE